MATPIKENMNKLTEQQKEHLKTWLYENEYFCESNFDEWFNKIVAWLEGQDETDFGYWIKKDWLEIYDQIKKESNQ